MFFKSWMKRIGLAATLLLLIGCVSLLTDWDRIYGPATPKEFQPATTKTNKLTYQDIKPIIDQRCTVCHGCYDAPCQLKLDSYQGLLRGASTEKIYDGARLLGAAPTRMFEDALTTNEWRSKGFFPVLNERRNNGIANIDASVMAQVLLLKQQHPLPKAPILSDHFNFSLNASHVCPSIEKFAAYKKSQPLWGMPYGLPAVSRKEHQDLINWLAQGAIYGKEEAVSNVEKSAIDQWEKLLNQDNIKSQLASRYIYEHLFLAQLFFGSDKNTNSQSRHYYRLVRSRTAPGQAIDRITSLRPYDDPQTSRVYYRLWRDPASVVAKTHMPYRLDHKRMAEWKKLFFDADYKVTYLPSYAIETASNPFITFAQIPIDSRYRFMLNEARFTIMNFIKGPVCRGQVALNVIQDHFWVFFFDPATQNSPENEKFLIDNLKQLDLPAEVGNSLRPISNWQRYAELQKEYLAAKAAFVSSLVQTEAHAGTDIIWNGDNGTNPNAALTIFRHSDSASVYQGMIGNPPKTAWVIGYPLLERIYYLLVSGFDVYGNVTHQLLSRVYMDFLRIEGEMNFIGLLPKDVAEKEITFWYRDAEDELNSYLKIYLENVQPNKNFTYTSDNPKLELYETLRQHLGAASNSPHQITDKLLAKDEYQLIEQLRHAPGKSIQFLPQTTIIRVPGSGLFTLVHNNAYSNISHLFGEEKRRIPAEDYLTVVRGIIGSYPNSFMQVNKKDLADFVAQISNLTSETDYQLLRDRYGIRRSNPRFWEFSDQVHRDYYSSDPNDAAILDYNRLEDR